MPQVDLETLVTSCAGGGIDRKIACETLAPGGEPAENEVIIDEGESTQLQPDLPVESFWLSKDAEYDWFDRIAFYERKESTKGNSNSNSNPQVNHNSSSNSQRYSVHLKKASIIGLPKTQKTTYVDSKRRTCKPPNIRLFPKRTGSSAGKSTAQVAEPGSPKVSCMGRVRSKRGRRRSNSIKRSEKPAPKNSRSGEEKRKNSGFYSKLINMFRSTKNHRKSSRSGSRRVMEDPATVEPQRRSTSVKVREIPLTANAERPALGGMKRFASGRRSGSWTSDDFN